MAAPHARVGAAGVLFGALLRLIAFAVGRLPFRALPRAGSFVGWLCGRVLRIRSAHVTAAMAIARVPRPREAADGMYRALGASLLEFVWLGGRAASSLPAGDELARLDEASSVALEGAARLGRGIVLAGAHTGNWELAACALAKHAPVLVVAKRLSVGVFDAFARRTRERYGVRLADPDGALGVAQHTLARGGWVTMLIDQVPADPSHGVPVSFLGQPALASRASAALAWRTGSPLLVVAARRVPSGAQELSVLDVLIPPPGAGRAWIDDATRQATRALERFVLTHPTEWLWLHRRWRLPSGAGAPCFSAAAPLHARAP